MSKTRTYVRKVAVAQAPEVAEVHVATYPTKMATTRKAVLGRTHLAAVALRPAWISAEDFVVRSVFDPETNVSVFRTNARGTGYLSPEHCRTIASALNWRGGAGGWVYDRAGRPVAHGWWSALNRAVALGSALKVDGPEGVTYVVALAPLVEAETPA